MPKLFLIDLMSLFFKSHMAMERRHLTTGDGLVISGVNGVLRTMLRIIRREEPAGIVVASDTGAPTFRHEIYPEYKAHRPPMPEEMAAQIPILYELLELAGLPVHRREGLEADDILATFALRARNEGWECYIVTSDKDLMQIVGDGVFIYNTKRGGELDLVGDGGVREKFGVDPEQVVDVLALMGDSSDNVPGVPRVGLKTAGDLVSRFGDLDGVYANLEELGKKAVRRHLEENRELAYLSKRLVTIDRDVPLDFRPGEAGLPDWGARPLVKRLEELDFRTILRDLATWGLLGEGAEYSAAPEQGAKVERVYHGIRDREQFEAFVKDLFQATDPEGNCPVCSFDLETTGLDPLACRIVGCSFSWKDGEAWYVPGRFPGAAESGTGDLFPEEAEQEDFRGAIAAEGDLALVLGALKPWYEDPRRPKTGQNCKYDINVLSQYGIGVHGVVFDTMLASYALRPSGRQHNLDALALEYLGEVKIPTTSLIGTGRKQISMAEVPFERVAEYACEDADVTRRLMPMLKKDLDQAGLLRLLEEIDLPVMAVLCRMEQRGVAVDCSLLEKLSGELQARLDLLESDIHQLAGEEFNLNSPKQLSHILYEKLKLKPGKRTQSGYSTDVRELERLARTEPLPRFLLDYRQLAKLKGTYADALPRLVNPRTGRIHSNFNQTIAATGRLSSTDPNLQNIPVRSDWGRRIREAFVAGGPRQVLIVADYSQIELRLLAHISGDESLSAAFREGEDIHSRTAAAIFGQAPEDVTQEMRRQAKVVNFGVIYGMGAYALAGNLEIGISEARRFIDEYFVLYSGVKQYVERTVESAREKGWVGNIFGRRRYLPDINSDNRVLRENTERIAVNTPIQGSAADLIKAAMINLDKRMASDLPDLKMISQVHDELIFEAPENRAGEYAALIAREMEQAVELSVPLVADVGWGPNWRDAK